MAVLAFVSLVNLICILRVNGDGWQEVRAEAVKSRECISFYKNEYDLCHGKKWPASLSFQTCKCDDHCHLYNDCCIDKNVVHLEDQTKSSVEWKCLDLPTQKSPLSVYAVKSCNDEWKNSEVKEYCTYGLTSQNLSYVSAIPVYSEKTRRLYRNIYCAFCNNDAENIVRWNIDIACSTNFDVRSVPRENLGHFLNDRNFNSSLNQWWFYNNEGKSSFCTFSITELNVEGPALSKYGFRPCEKVVDSCVSGWNDLDVAFKCKSYTAYIFLLTKSYTSVGFKNYHCALCNRMEDKELTCEARKPYSGQPLPLPYSLSLLVDFNPKRGNIVGQDTIYCPLERGLIFDPISRKCVSTFCGKAYIRDEETNRCILRDDVKYNNYLNSSCLKVLVPTSSYVLLPNASIWLNRTAKVLNKHEFEMYEANGSLSSGILICANEFNFFVPQFIFLGYQQIVTALTLTLSSVCLVVHIAIYAFVPKLQNVPGKNLCSLAVVMLIANLSFIFGFGHTPEMQVNTLYGDRGSLPCVFFAITMHYAFLASAFWMNVMAFDVWLTFGLNSHHSRSSNKTFYKYSLYSWLSAGFIVLMACAFDIALKNSQIRPLYGYAVCWLSQRKALFVFFVLPLFTLIGVNITLYVLTITSIMNTKQQTRMVNNTREEETVKVYLYFKLALVMGLTWAFAMLAALFDNQHSWILFVIFHGLQGAFIFVVFTCKRHVWELIQERIAYLRTGNLGRLDTNTKNSSLTLAQHLSVSNKNIALEDKTLDPEKLRRLLEAEAN